MSSILLEKEKENKTEKQTRYNTRVEFREHLDRVVEPLRWYISGCATYCWSCICEFANIEEYRKDREENYRKTKEWGYELNQAEQYLRYVVWENGWRKDCGEDVKKYNRYLVLTRHDKEIDYIEDKLDEKKGEGVIVVTYGGDNPRRVQIYSDERGNA